MSACRSCGADVQGGSCEYCGNPAAPEPVREPAPGSQACPRCSEPTELFRHAAGGAAVFGCPGCGGLWVPAESLEPLVEEGAKFTPSQPGGDRPQPLRGDVRYLKCPCCSQLMARKNYARVSGVIVDACPDHGVWLDAGELQALRVFVASGGRKKEAAAEQEKARLEQRLRELRRTVVSDVRSGYSGGGDFFF